MLILTVLPYKFIPNQLRTRSKTKSKSAHALWLGIAMAINLVPATSIAEVLVTNPWDKKLQPYVDESNSRLPAIVAPSVRQERDSVFNGVLTHSYTILAKTAAELIKSNLAATQRPLIFPSICNDPYTGRMLREGVTFRYMYFGKDGKPAAQLVFFPSDCSSVR